MNDKINKLDRMSESPDKQMLRLLDKFSPQIKKALPKHLSPDRMTRIVMTAVSSNPKLAQAGVESPATFLGSIIQSSQLGLEVNTPAGHAYLVPFRNKRKRVMECQLIVGYKGMIDLAYRSPLVEKVVARAVYDGDEFDYWYGLNENLIHKISKEPCRRTRKITHAYAFAQIRGKGCPFEVLDQEALEYRRGKSMDDRRAKENNRTSIWESEPEAMSRKSAIRALSPFIPQAPELAHVVALEEAQERGEVDVDPSITEIFSGETAIEVGSESKPVDDDLNEPPDDVDLPKE